MLRRILPLLCVALACTACLQMEQTITLTADGSGRQEVTLTLPESTLQEIERAAAANQTGTAISPKALFDQATVARELKDAGLELAAHKTESIGRAKRVQLDARFASPAQLRKSPLAGSAAEWEFAAGEKPGTTRMTLYPQGKQAWSDARARALEGKAADAVAADFFVRRQAQLVGLDVTVRFKLPGKVIEYTRNLELTAPDEVTAKITAAQIKTPEDLVRRLAPRFEVVFDSSACKFPLDR